MATSSRKEAFLQTLEFIYDSSENPKKHYIHPMISKDLIKVQELFAKFNDEYIIYNYPHPRVDDQGNLVLNEDGEEIIETEAFEAMAEVIEIALEEPWEVAEQWISLRQIQEVLAAFRGISGLLRKKREMEAMILSTSVCSQQD